MVKNLNRILKIKFKTLQILVLMGFVTGFCNAQNYRAIYDFSYKPDSTKDYKIMFPTVLDIQKEHTYFYYYKMFQLDSLYQQNEIFSHSFAVNQRLKRLKNSSDNTNYVQLNGLYFSFPSKDVIHWQIQKETGEWESYKTQMAKASWGGRDWIAWFAPDIPIQKGPYKFRGLPGLITSVEDSKVNFEYRLKSLQKSGVFDPKDFIETNFGQKPRSITEKQYQRLMLTYFTNPFAEFQTLSNSFGLEINGKEYTDYSDLLKILPEYRKDLLRNYNPIERDKAVHYIDR